MKFLKTFENFYLPTETEEEYCEPCESENDDHERMTKSSNDDLPEFTEEDEFPESEFQQNARTMRFEAKKTKGVSYKKSGLKNPEKADRNKNNKIEGWEKAVAKKIEASMDKKSEKGLTKAQMKLPPALRKAIAAKKNKK